MRIPTIVMCAMMLAPVSLTAQTSHENKTGLPEYPNLANRTQYEIPQQDSGHSYLMFTAESRDEVPVVEAWYRKALPKATERPKNTNATYGYELTNGGDKVQVYKLGQNGKGAVVELWKLVPSN